MDQNGIVLVQVDGKIVQLDGYIVSIQNNINYRIIYLLNMFEIES
jgi:hypothetical protein